MEQVNRLSELNRGLGVLFKSAPAAIAYLRRVDGELVYQYANASYEKLVGREKLFGQKLFEIFPGLKRDNPELVKIIENVSTRGTRFQTDELPVKLDWDKSGTPTNRYLKFNYEPVLDDQGQPEGLTVFAFDITDQVLLRRKVEESKYAIENERENFRNLFRQTPEMVCILRGPDHLFEFVNEAHVKVLGFDATGKTVREAQPESVEVHGILDEVYRTGKTAELHEIPVTVTNRLRYFNLTYAARRDVDGKINGVMVLGVEITGEIENRRFIKEESERTNERLRFLAESTRRLVSTLELENILRELTFVCVPFLADWCSVQLVQPNGRLKQLAVAHKDPEKVKWAWDLNNKYPPVETTEAGPLKVLRTGEGEFLTEISPEMVKQAATDTEHLKILEELGFYSYICVPIKVRESGIGVLTLVTTSESKRRYQEADMRFAQELADRAGIAVENSRLYKEAKNLNQVKDEFLATLSHELRTPINVIQGHADMLSSDFDKMSDKEVRDSIAAIQRNTKLQTQIVSDLLDVSSIITGKIAYVPQAISPTEVVTFISNAIKPAAVNKGVKVHFEMKNPPQMILADPTRLQQILWNLSNNAVKFTPSGGEVWISVSGENDKCIFSVKDTGIGIDPNFLPYVFDRFRQADSSMSRRFGGLGLGLSIVKNLVEIHGGSVSVRSEGLGKGSEFIVELPVKTNYSYSIPTIDRKPQPMEEQLEYSLSGLTVLLVEDSADNRELVLRFLQKKGAKVIAAESPAKAREILETVTPDIILSDIGMPEENGLDFIRRLRSESTTKFIPALALTAYVRPQEIDEALSAGFQGHIAKPVSPASLVKGIAAALERS